MRISAKDWSNYVKKLSSINKKAGEEMLQYIEKNGITNRRALIDYAYALATKYGEGAAALACDMYDAIAIAEGVTVAAAIPAQTATIDETAKAINGVLKQSPTGQLLNGAVERLVKQTSADTMLQNAKRDGAEFAWITSGDTCAFCLALSSRGWQYQSRNAMQGDHAEHIHANCDCQYAVRFNKNTNVAGYDPDALLEKYNSYGGNSATKINAMRREAYAKHKDEINEQKREAYAIRVGNEEV